MFGIDLDLDANKQEILIEKYIAASDKTLEWYSNNWWTTTFNDGGSQETEKEIDLRDENKYGATAYTSTSVSGVPYIAEYDQQIVLQESPDWDTLDPSPSIGPTLGWKTQTYLYPGITGHTTDGYGDNKYVSPSDDANVPDAEADHSLFVRCPTLTQQSFNFGKGSMSKIIYHCPMFSNTGKSTGALFFQPSERVYIDLGNRETLNLNQLSLDIVDRNEQISNDLTGNTTICLHIKTK